MKGNNKYTEEMITEEAKKYNSKAEFKYGHAQMYRSAIRKGILEDICSHMMGNIRFWTDEDLKQEASKYEHRGDFQKHSYNAWQTARKRGLMDQICSHMAYLSRPKYSLEELKTIALQYNKRVEFEKGNLGAYASAHRQGVIDEVCKHMSEPRNIPWTDREIHTEARKYKTRTNFQHKSKGAYKAANRKEMLDDVCKHMSHPLNISSNEQLLFDAIRKHYPKAQKLRDRKAKFEDKTYIKGFDIDIYIPERRKGIEFDGRYWHSVDGLKRSRKDWPEEDLINYHQIKDDYFKSKGIEILHITEKEWLENKEECLKRCFEFLES